MKFLDWVNEVENQYFLIHVLSVLVLIIASEILIPHWTLLAFPAILLLAGCSFMYNYPVKAIKDHGLFSEWLIELRLLWLVLVGFVLEIVALNIIERGLPVTLTLAGLVTGLALVIASKNHLQEKLVKARGF